MTADRILRGLIDCNACGHDWPRVCAYHRDLIEEYSDKVVMSS